MVLRLVMGTVWRGGLTSVPLSTPSMTKSMEGTTYLGSELMKLIGLLRFQVCKVAYPVPLVMTCMLRKTARKCLPFPARSPCTHLSNSWRSASASWAVGRELSQRHT